MITLRYLTTSDSQTSLAFSFRAGRSTFCKIVRETCQSIWMVLTTEYLKHPSTTGEWRSISSEFEREWNFPHCLGALDGKHVIMECPRDGGSAFYNYKSFHSIVLLAICDAKYCFTFVDIGASGGGNNTSVLSNSAFGRAFEYAPNSLEFP